MKRILIYCFILFAMDASASVVKDTCYSRIDSVSNRTLKICVKKKSKCHSVWVAEPGQLFSRPPQKIVKSVLARYKKKKYIIVYSNNKVIYQSYLKTKRIFEVQMPSRKILIEINKWPDISENAKNKINDTEVIKKHKITKWNDDGTKETLEKINDHLDYRHIVYDSKNKKIKTEVINNNSVKWDEWRFEKEE